MRTKPIFAVMMFALVAVVFACPSYAQLPAGANADALQPSGAPDPMKEDQIWQVDPLTGALNVKIPFSTTPQGGRGPKIPFSLSYNSSSVVTLEATGTVAGGSGPLYTFAWQSPASLANVSSNVPNGPWTTSGPFSYSSTTSAQPYSVVSQYYTTYYYGCDFQFPFIYVDETGAGHDMNVDSITIIPASGSPSQPAPGCADQPTGSSVSPGATSDGSVLQTTADGDPLVIQPDGTVLHPASSAPYTFEDTNGNLSTLASDSLGRTPFSTNIPIGRGGEIPDGTYYVHTTGPTGATEAYSVEFKTITGGTFTMPHPTTTEFTSIANLPVNQYNVSLNNVDSGSTTSDITSITLPAETVNGSTYSPAYTFAYDPTYGTLSKITFPSGGYVRFVYNIRAEAPASGAYTALSAVVVTDVYLCDGVNPESHWAYTYTGYVANQPLASQVEAPDSTVTKYQGQPFTYSNYWITPPAPSWKVTEQDTYSASGPMMKSVSTVWNSDGTFPASVATTLYDATPAIQSQVVYKYDSYDNVTEKDESSFSTCSGTPPCPISTTPTWLRKTLTTYQYSKSSSWVTAHIVNKPYSVLVTDGSGTPLALTINYYDQSGHLGSTPTGISTHDDTNYGPTSTLPRGNLTTETRCITISGTGSSATCATSTSTYYYYDLTGQITCKVDGAGLGTNQVTGCPTAGLTTTSFTWGGQKNGFLLTVTHANGKTDTYTYFTPTGQINTHTDPNSNTTTYSYIDPTTGTADPLNRVRTVKLPQTKDGTTNANGTGLTTYTYIDTALAMSVQEQHLLSTNLASTSTTTSFDGLGRKIETQTLSPSCSSQIEVNIAYDSMGRVESVTNPYCSTSDPTYGVTVFQYDWMSRKVCEYPQGFASIPSTCAPGAGYKSWTYGGNAATSQDESGNQWKRISDSLGRLTNVFEPNGASAAPSMETDYSYSGLNDLLGVTQWGGAYGSSGARTRSFTYDSLSRLLTSSNPESGAISYTYDGNGNLTSKTSPAVNATTGTQTVYYCYDALNRLTYKYVYGGTVSCSAPYSLYASAFAYDGNSLTGTAVSSPAYANAVGHLTDEQRIEGHTIVSERVPFAYDAMGRLTAEQQVPYSPLATAYPFNYTYDLAGDTIQFNNGMPSTGSGTTSPAITWQASYDTVARLSGLEAISTPYGTSNANYPPYLINLNSTSPASYNPLNQIAYERAAQMSSTGTPALTITDAYDPRAWILSENATGINESGPSQSSFGVIAVTGTEQSGDTGSVTVSVTDTNTGSETYGQTLATTGAVAWGSSSTTTTLVSALLSAINTAASRWITAAADDTGGSVSLSSVAAGSAYDYGIQVTATDTAGKTASFTFDFSSTTGGTNGSTTGNYPVYTYSVPPGGYAANGNLLAHSDSVMGDWAFQYDTLNRLTVMAPSNNVPSADSISLGCYAYDAFGNRTLDVLTYSADDLCSSHPASEYSSYTTHNQTATVYEVTDSGGTDSVTSVPLTYDAAGNVTSDGTNAYVYDAEGRICAVENLLATSVTAYYYDASGTRVAKGTPTAATLPVSSQACNPATNGFTLTAEYLLDQGGNQVTELNNQVPLTGTQTVAWAHSNVWSGAHLSATYDMDDECNQTTGVCTWTPALHFHLSDPLGTRRVQIDPNGTAPYGMIESFSQSLPYGDAQVVNFWDPNSGDTLLSADDATEHHFTGKERDAESGNDYFEARYYGSTMGRFLSPDDDSGQEPSDPQSLNLYPYVRNNPLTHTDPSGHDCVVQTRTDDHHETVTSSSGTCAGVSLQSGQSATYVNGTVDGWQKGADGHSLDISFHNGDGSGVQNAAGAPAFDHPGIDGPANAAVFGRIGNEGVSGIKAFVAGSVVLGTAGGLGLSALGTGAGLTTIGDVASPLLTSQEAAQAIGWGTHFEGAGLEATKELAANLTQEDVASMESRGLTLGDAEKWRKLYQTAVDAGKGAEQAKARLALMNKIIRIMVGGR